MRHVGIDRGRQGWVVASLVMLGVGAGSCGASTPTDVAVTDDPIVGGETTVRWEAVGYMSDGQTRCTATLIAPNVMLTAGHCTLRGTEIRVGFGAYRSFENLSIRATQVRRAPSFGGDGVAPHDVAILVIDQPQSIPPIPLSGSNPPTGAELRAIGYGDDNSGISAPESGSNKPRKTAHVVVTETHPAWIATRGQNGAACFGDSGGPLMDLDGTRIYGVMSLIYPPCTSTTRNDWAAVAGESFVEDEIRSHPPVPRSAGTVLWRYWNPTNTDHYYTIDRNDAGLAALGWGIEKGEGFVFRSAFPGTAAILRYWNLAAGDHFYTIYPGELGFGALGYTLERVEGYCFPRSYSGTVPLHRYFNGGIQDHFYSTTRNDFGYAIYGYSYEGVACYVYP